MVVRILPVEFRSGRKIARKLSRAVNFFSARVLLLVTPATVFSAGKALDLVPNSCTVMMVCLPLILPVMTATPIS